jgi:hypothetical protein
MANYGVTNSTNNGAAQVAVAATDITLVALFASTIAPAPTIQLRRGKMYDLLVGANGTPADNSLSWIIQRATTGSTLTGAGMASSNALGLDQADSTPASYVCANSSVETAYTVVTTNVPWYVAVNQRASYRWVAAPCSGIIARVKSVPSGYTGTATASIMWSE